MKCAYYSCLVIAQLSCYALQGQFYFTANHQPEPELMWELGVSTGAMNCLTDLGGRNGTGKKFIKDINLNQSQFCGSVYASGTWQSLYGIRLQAGAGQITGTDDVLKNSSGPAYNRYLRHLHFRTTIIELSVITEIHLLAILRKHRDLPLLSPYLAAGAGFFSYTPKARFNNRWIGLRPLHTEGQGFAEYPDRSAYQQISWCLPLGAGVKYDAGRLLNLRLELLYRFTGTDYLDDVSKKYIDPALFSKYLPAVEAATAATVADRSAELAGGIANNKNAIRGNPANKDAYFSFMLSISIALGRIPHK
jgi:hypothetical protein